MKALVVLFAVALLGGMAAVLAADAGSAFAGTVARVLVPIGIVLGVSMFLVRVFGGSGDE